MKLPLPEQIIKRTGYDPMHELLLDVSLRQFPDYLVFMDAVRQGCDPDKAAQFCRQYRSGPYVPPPAPVMQPQPVQNSRSRASFLATLMGQDDSF